jgi:hypothetical protein
MSDREKILEDALRRVLEKALIDGGPLSPEEIHDAIGHEVIMDVMFAERWVLGVNADPLFHLAEVVDNRRVAAWDGSKTWDRIAAGSHVRVEDEVIRLEANGWATVGHVPATHAQRFELTEWQADPKFEPFEEVDLQPYLDVVDHHVKELAELDDPPQEPTA